MCEVTLKLLLPFNMRYVDDTSTIHENARVQGAHLSRGRVCSRTRYVRRRQNGVCSDAFVCWVPRRRRPSPGCFEYVRYTTMRYV